MLIGTNADEGQALMTAQWADEQTYDLALESTFGPLAEQVRARYRPSDHPPPPGSTFSSSAWAAKALLTDMLWACPARRTARAAARAGEPVFLFHNTLPMSAPPEDPFFGTGVATMTPYLLNNDNEQGLPGFVKWVFDEDEERLSQQVMGYWTRFARTGDPDGGGAVTWPRYNEVNDRHLELGATIEAGRKLKQAECDFWDALSGE